MERHSNLFVVQACGVMSGPPLPLPFLHRVGGEAPSLLARSDTGLQRTCNQIKHTLHLTQNASIFYEVFLSSQTSLNPTTHVTSVLMMWSCVVWVGRILLKARTGTFELQMQVSNCKQLAWHGITWPQGSLSPTVSFQKGYHRAALSLLIRNSLHIAVTTV